MLLRQYYASECYGWFGVFQRCGTQVGGWWPTMELAEHAARLANAVNTQPNPIAQTLWRVKFNSRSDMIVTAATLLDVARHVGEYCKDTSTSPKDIVKIEYLAY